MTYNDLKKNIRRNKDKEFEKRLNIAILGDTATQFLATATEGMGYEYGIKAGIYEAEYDVIESEVLDMSSGLYEEKRDHIIIYMSTEKAREKYEETSEENRADFAEDYIKRIGKYWNILTENTDARIIQMNFVKIDTGVFGNYAMTLESSFEYQLQKLNFLLSELATGYKNVFLIDLNGIQARFGSQLFLDEKFYYQARMSIGFDALVETVKSIYDVILALMGRIHKCMILDLDNTLWGGVIGDDGLSGIEIGELGSGRAYTDLQKWCRELKKRGILLAICSKNDEDTAKEPFEKHPDMVLKLEDFVMFVANWDDKASNIRKIQATLNIGMDSLVFIDDNPFERNLVRQSIPEITVPELPEDPAEYLSFLQNGHYFETVTYSGEDVERTKQYRTEALRKSAVEEYTNIDEYLKSLDMRAKAKAFDEFHYPRIAELSQRSNQFNLRTVRYTEEDIKNIADSDRYITRYFSLEDKFGDYGLISVVIAERTGDTEAFIDTWFMSCRVLKRGMEEFIINTLVKTCRQEGIKKLKGEYIATAKNKMVSDIYAKFGFEDLGGGKYELDTEKFKMLNSYIKEAVES